MYSNELVSHKYQHVACYKFTKLKKIALTCKICVDDENTLFCLS